MIRVRQVKVPVLKTKNLKQEVAKKLNLKESDILEMKIHKESLDARRKPQLYYIYEVDIKVADELKIFAKNKSLDVLLAPEENYIFNITGDKSLNNRPVIIGAGPAGLFAAYVLAENGYAPIVYERGEKIEDRVNTVEHFWKTGKLKTESNVQFGEGGAGTFSDGKLNTLVKDDRFIMQKVYETFVECGAPEEILYLNKPHIGTDLLRQVVINMRNKIISMGGEIKYNSCFNDFEVINNKLTKIKINDEWLDCDNLILAIGHSARDTFKMLYDKKIIMQPKPFAVGVRIEHPQDLINKNQYGEDYPSFLPAASYKLTHTTKNNRGVYTFCMCPGGFVVNASSENEMLAVNGMSNYKRDTKNANSAVIVTITPEDFGSNPLDGLKFQREIEQKAFKLGQGKIPTQLFKDYLKGTDSISFGNMDPMTKGDYAFADLNKLFPDYINESLKEGILAFDKKINGFAREDAILFGVESRTSSPVKILRNELCISNIEGIYPCGEGAGYAGGITSSAMDGIKVAEKLATIYKPNKY